MGKLHEEGFDILKPTDHNISRIIEIGIQLGKLIVIENIQELDSSFDTFLVPKQVNDSSNSIMVGEKVIELNP